MKTGIKITAALLSIASMGAVFCACDSGTTTTSSKTESVISSTPSKTSSTSSSPSAAPSSTSSQNTSSTVSKTSTVTSSQVVSEPEVNLEEALLKQPCYVQSTEYFVQDENYKNLYPDMLCAIVKNNSGNDIKNITIAFAAWDKNNFPVKMVPKGYRNGYYVIKCVGNDVNIVKGGTWGQEEGFEIGSDTINVTKLKAIVVSYEDFNGNTWTNPLYSKWKNTYENKKLS